jgi:5,10-methylenetetrahydromethanopterin reductase
MRADDAEVQFGFMMGVSPREPIRRAAALAREAEEVGFAAMWLADSQLYLKNSYVALTIAALETERIHLGPGVTNPITRHVTVTANAAAALAEVSGGRFELGIGSGDAAVFPLGLKPARLAELRRNVERLHAFAAGDEAEIDDRTLSVAPGGTRYPVFISASQPRMLQLAGAVADGVIVMGAADAALTRWQLDHVAAGAREAGRDPGELFVDLWFAISLSEDRDQAVRDVRPWATSQARWFHQWKELPAPLQPYRAELKAAHDAYDFGRHLSRHESGTPAVSDEFVDWIGVAGDLGRCVEKIRPLVELGIDRITFALLPGGRSERLRRYGHELIPALQSAVATGS